MIVVQAQEDTQPCLRRVEPHSAEGYSSRTDAPEPSKDTMHSLIKSPPCCSGTIPSGSNFEPNADEYQAEAESIVIGLPHTKSPDDVHHLTYDVFVHWFDATTASPLERYPQIAEDIWSLWRHGATAVQAVKLDLSAELHPLMPPTERSC